MRCDLCTSAQLQVSLLFVSALCATACGDVSGILGVNPGRGEFLLGIAAARITDEGMQPGGEIDSPILEVRVDGALIPATSTRDEAGLLHIESGDSDELFISWPGDFPRYTVTTARDILLDDLRRGRLHMRVPEQPETTGIEVRVEGLLDIEDDEDHGLELLSLGAGLDVYFEHETVARLHDEGTVRLTLYPPDPEDEYGLIESSENDELWMLQTRSTSGGDFVRFYAVVAGGRVDLDDDMEDGEYTPAQVDVQADAGEELAIRWAHQDFRDALQNSQIGSENVSIELASVIEPSEFPWHGNAVTLFFGAPKNSPGSSHAILDVEYANPFPANWHESIGVFYGVEHKETIGSYIWTFTTSMGRYVSGESARNAEIDVSLTPPIDLTIDELSPDLARTRLNTGSVLAWSPPSTGVADYYAIDLVELLGAESQNVASFRVYGETFEMPAGMVTTSGRYIISITAYQGLADPHRPEEFTHERAWAMLRSHSVVSDG